MVRTADRPRVGWGFHRPAPPPTSPTGWRAIAANTLAIAAVVLAGWWVEPFRELVAPWAPRLPMLLYGAAGVALAASWRRRAAGPGPLAGAGARVAGMLRHGGPAAAASAYLVPLYANWETARFPVHVAGGIIPWSDATLYFGGALRVLLAGGVDDYGASRPIHPAFLAVRLALTGMDLRKALVVGTVLLGVACYLAARAVAKDLGAAAGMALFAGMYGFGISATGSLMTESLGLTFGALALACLWPAARTRSLPLGLAGIVLMTVAQCVRSGTLLVLPALVLWLGVHFRRRGAVLNWRALGLAALAVLAGLAVNVGALVATGGRLSALNGHSGFVLYGLATGHPSWEPGAPNWTQIFEDHPGVAMTGAAGSAFANDAAMEAIRQRPATFVAAVLRSGWNYLELNLGSALAPISTEPARAAVTVLAVLVAGALLARRRAAGTGRLAIDAALLLAAVACILPLDDAWIMGVIWEGLFPIMAGAALVAFAGIGSGGASAAGIGLALFTLAGCIASAPLLGTDVESGRNFAASVPIMALPFALAAGILARRRAGAEHGGAEQGGDTPAPASPGRDWAPALIGAGVLAVSLVGAPIAAAAVNRPAFVEHRCADGTIAHAFYGGVALRVVSNEAGAADRLDELETEAMELWAPFGWRLGPAVIPGTDAGQGRPASEPPGTRTMVAAINADGHDRILYVDAAVDAPGTSALYLCGRDVVSAVSVGMSRVFWPPPITFDFFDGSPPPGRP